MEERSSEEAGSALGPAQRALALRRLGEERFDLVVVGGGVTGAGVALDAATRGLSVALLEARDLAFGTSSRSGKAFHGGLRYLQRLDLGLVRQASHERNLMVGRLCPHLAWPTPFIYPLVRPGLDRLMMGAGLALYDLLGGRRPEGITRPRHLGRAGVARLAPALDPGRLVGGVQYHDAIVDDARHTVAVARTALRHGALVAAGVEVTGMVRAGGRVAGVEARDRETGQSLTVRGRCVVNASGVWADLVQQLAGEALLEVRPAKGVHLVIPRDRIDAQAALIAPTADSVLVVRPWWRYWIIGTTDTPWEGDRGDPAASAADVDYLLAQVNGWLRAPLSRRDIVGVFAGVRPLLHGRGSSTAALSREHAVLEGPPGLVTVAGGKYTTYRVMARDAVDAALRSAGSPVPPCVTDTTPLVGAEGWRALLTERERLARSSGLSLEAVDHLLRRHGALVHELLALLVRRPELARPLAGAPDYLEAELLYAATHEGALHLDDALARRTHVAMETPDRGLSAAGRAAELLGEALGWDALRREREVADYRRGVEADLRSEAAPDDAAAVAARYATPLPALSPSRGEGVSLYPPREKLVQRVTPPRVKRSSTRAMPPGPQGRGKGGGVTRGVRPSLQPERRLQLPRLVLQELRVARAHAQEVLLHLGERLQLGVGVLVQALVLHLHHRHLTLDERRALDAPERLERHRVEARVGVAQGAVGRLHRPAQLGVGAGHRLGVEAGHGGGEGVVALVGRGVDDGAAPLPHHRERAARAEEAELLAGRDALGQVVGHHRPAADDVALAQPAPPGGLLRDLLQHRPRALGRDRGGAGLGQHRGRLGAGLRDRWRLGGRYGGVGPLRQKRTARRITTATTGRIQSIRPRRLRLSVVRGSPSLMNRP